MKGHLSIIMGFLILSLVLVSCTEPQVPGNSEIKIEDEKPVTGGQLNIGSVEPNSFNPINNKSKSYIDVSNLIFNGLFEYDENQKIVPVLAKEINIMEESGQGIVKLRDDIFWSDGSKVTASDVKFTIDTIKTSPNSIYKSNLAKISYYQVVDEETIKINFNKPYYNAIEQLCFPIIPKHIFAFNENSVPLGTGPYKVLSYKRLKYMELVPNELWWKKEKPYISKIKVVFINDTIAFDTCFESREIDALHASSYDWEKYKELKGVNTFKYTSSGFEFISINHQNPLLLSKEIRKAMMYGINRKSIADKFLLGHAILTDTPIKPGSWLDDGHGVKYNYSKAEAQYILNNAGFSYNSQTKVFEKEIDNKKKVLRFSLITNSENEYRRKAAEEIKKNLEEIGFVIDLKIMPFDEVKKTMESKKYDLVLTGLNVQPGQDLYTFLHSSQIIGGKNYGSYSNSDMDFLFESLSETTSAEIIHDNYVKIQEIIREELPFISLFYKEYALVIRNKVKGTIEPDSQNPFRTIEKWYINEPKLEDTLSQQD